MLQWVCGVSGGLGLVLLAIASGWFGYNGALVATVVLGIALTAYQTLNNTMIMDEARPEYYGRVMSINMLTFSAMPLMAMPLGAVADKVGASEAFVAEGLIVVVFMALVGVANSRYTFGIQRRTPREWESLAGSGAGAEDEGAAAG